MKAPILTARHPNPKSPTPSNTTIFLVLSLLILSTGCGAIKSALRPMVCDCEAELACADGSVPRVVDVAPGDDPESEGQMTTARAEGEDDETQEEKESTLVASSFQVPEARHDLDDDKRTSLKRDYSLRAELDNAEMVLEGQFSSSSSEDAVVVSAETGLTIAFGGGGKTNRDDFSQISEQSFVSQVVHPIVAARVVDDGRLELITQEVVSAESGNDETYVRLSVYKVFGGELARIFEIPIAERSQSGEWKKLREIRFLNGVRARWIEVIDLGENPTPEIYRWNRWEGMFRIPTPVPTAPGRSPVRDIEPDDDTSSNPISLLGPLPKWG